MKTHLALRLLLSAGMLAALALMAGASDPLCWEGGEAPKPEPAAAPPGTAEGGRTTPERERLLAMGRGLFFQKCGSCHDADGSKPMSDGPPLNQRKVSEERVSRVVDSRFKSANEEQRRAVKLHINTFMKR